MSRKNIQMNTCVYGYARVSSRDQNLDRQISSLMAKGIHQKNIYIDRQSGKDFCRPSYRRLFRRVRRGDTIMITSIDRLGRNYADIIEQWRLLTKAKGVAICVLDMPILCMDRPRDLTLTLIGEIVLQLLSYVAEIERNMIRSRQAEGIAAARARGVRFGAPRKTPPANFREVAQQWSVHALSERKAALALGVSRSTFRRWAEESYSGRGSSPKQENLIQYTTGRA